MGKRNIIAEIVERKRRDGVLWSEASHALWGLDVAIRAQKLEDGEKGPHVAAFIPSITACIEVSVKWALRELVDFGSPYSDRIAGFRELLRFDLELTAALQSRKITFGDLISHLVKVGSVEDIGFNLKTLLDRPLGVALAEVRTFAEPHPSVYSPWGSDLDDWIPDESEFIIDDVDRLLGSIASLFALRHQIVHEARFFDVTADQLNVYVQDAVDFIEALEELIIQTLRPNVPRSGPGMALYAQVLAHESKAKMDAAFEKLLKLVSERAEVESSLENWGAVDPVFALREAQAAFDYYLRKEIEFDGANTGSVSGNSLSIRDSSIRSELCAARERRLLQLVSEMSCDYGGPGI